VADGNPSPHTVLACAVHNTFEDWLSARRLESQRLLDQLVLECFMGEVKMAVVRFKFEGDLF